MIRTPLLLALAATVYAQTPATYAEYGNGCNGNPIVTAYAINAASPTLTVSSLPNEYAFPVFNSTAAPVQVLGFDVYTRTNTLAVEVGNAGVFRDNSGAGATTHTQPAPTGEGVGTIEVTGTPGWFSVAVSPPVMVQPGEAFWVQMDAYSKIAPPQNTAGGTAAPATIYYRRPTLNAYAWTASVSVTRPILRVTAASAASAVASLIHTTLPVSGQTLSLTIQNGPALATALVSLGFSDTLWLGLPLPLDLAIVGVPNCTVFASLDHFFAVQLDGTGTGTWSLPIPNGANLHGLRFFNQALILGAPNPLSAHLTNAGRGTIGV